jgi:hypothetical protein
MADVANYSLMMGENEERTVHVFRGHRQIFDELLRAHRRRSERARQSSCILRM